MTTAEWTDIAWHTVLLLLGFRAFFKLGQYSERRKMSAN